MAPLGASLAPRGAHIQGLSTLSFYFFRAESLSSLVLYLSSEGLDIRYLVAGTWVPPRRSPALRPLRDTQQGDGTAWGGDLWDHSSVEGHVYPITPSLEPADPQEEICARRGAVGRGRQGRAAPSPLPAGLPPAFPFSLVFLGLASGCVGAARADGAGALLWALFVLPRGCASGCWAAAVLSILCWQPAAAGPGPGQPSGGFSQPFPGSLWLSVELVQVWGSSGLENPSAGPSSLSPGAAYNPTGAA